MFGGGKAVLVPASSRRCFLLIVFQQVGHFLQIAGDRLKRLDLLLELSLLGNLPPENLVDIFHGHTSSKESTVRAGMGLRRRGLLALPP